MRCPQSEDCFLFISSRLGLLHVRVPERGDLADTSPPDGFRLTALST